jgi:hypothetical protein
VEAFLIETIARNNEFCIGLSTGELVILIQAEFPLFYANQHNKPTLPLLSPTLKTKAIRDWVYRCLKRNQFSIRAATHVAQKTLSVEECLDFIGAVNDMVALYSIHDDFIINMDQTGVYMDNRHSTSIVDKGSRHVSCIESKNGSSHCSVFLAVTRSGKKLPPLVVFKGKPKGKIEKELKNFFGAGQACFFFSVNFL